MKHKVARPDGQVEFKCSVMAHSHQIICSRLSDQTGKELGVAPIASNSLKPVQSDSQE